MRIGVFDPYLDTLGGGERYILTAASYLSKNHAVDIFWNDSNIKKNAENKLGIDLSSVNITTNIFSSSTSLLSKIMTTKKYDLILFSSDGSIPLLFAKKNILIFQFPVNWVNGRSFLNKAKLKNIDKVVCYTNFVKHYLDITFGVNSYVLYPPAESGHEMKDVKKENIILTVGRFTKAMNMKKQEVLIEAFIKLCNDGLKNWKLILVGSYLPGDASLVTKIKNIAKNYPVEIKVNATFFELSEYYAKAKIYWHAAGYGEDLELHPERAEHFGITTVEAMRSGAVPVVINAGGQKEIVENDKNGFLWNSTQELEEKSLLLINNNSLWKKMSSQARTRAEEFSVEKFCLGLEKIIS